MADEKDMQRIIEDAGSKINKTLKETIPTGNFAFQYLAEDVVSETKKEIIATQGSMEKATAYLNSAEGKKYFADLITQKTRTNASKDLGNLPAWRVDSLIANYLPEQQRLMQGINQTGAMYHAGNHVEILEPNIGRNAYAHELRLSDFDKTAVPGLMKSVGADKYIKDMKNVSNLNAARIYATHNNGGTPIGSDVFKKLGLTDLLKDDYKKD